MINIVVPMAGPSIFYDSPEFAYPKPLIEINGKMMLERVVGYLNSIEGAKRFIFILNEEDAHKFHLDNIAKLVAGKESVVVKQAGRPKGAVCSILLAISHILNDEPLIISNCDQVIDYNLNKVVRYFMHENADAGVICFDSVHPKWSYALEDEQRNVVEMAEKRPISRNAVAGFYYFKGGSQFVDCAMKSIERNASVNDLFYIAPTINELILENKKVLTYKIDNSNYFSFYAPSKLQDYVNWLNRGSKV